MSNCGHQENAAILLLDLLCRRGHDCSRIVGSQSLLHKSCSWNYWVRFSFRKGKISFRKVQISISQSTDFISQSTDFISFRSFSQSTISQSTISPWKSEHIACVAGGIRERASEEIHERRSREWISRLPHFVWFLLAAHFYHLWLSN